MLQANSTNPCTDKSMLGDVCGWLVLNSMLSDRLQFNVLQTQNLSNIWRKNAWNTLMSKYSLLQLPEIVDCIEAGTVENIDVPQKSLPLPEKSQVFKEPIDFKVLDKVPVPRGLLQIVQGRAEEYTKYILTEEDRTAVEWVWGT